ncbi:MAG: (4Fe-4S)-binding protein [Desulfobulbaceae bacterium BRH_c16a]|nr:MAG: (4Fe-4S)-binding protein [Desulfobulbaceae bacterium BRH_c16a]
MIISIASGKGGTGKTTVATNLALSLGDGVRLLDCDVEEPNCHLFLHPVMTDVQDVTTCIPVIRQEACNGCKKCAEICRFRALTVVAGKVLVFPELCHSCGGCIEVCPEKAIDEGYRVLGVMESGKCGELGFAHGRLRVGEAMAPPLIRKVRASRNGEKTIIIDAPPGTSCPVIAAMRGTDFVLLVTEPTPFGLHDLRLAVEAVKLLGIPCGLVINRADMGDDGVREYAEREGIPVLLEIPYDRKIAEAYSRGSLIVEVMPEWAERFRRLYSGIVTLAGSSGRQQ